MIAYGKSRAKSRRRAEITFLEIVASMPFAVR
jgi:hypothetical protein